MKFLDGNSYVEVKDHRYKILPAANKVLRKREPPTSLRTQYHVQKETQIRRNQKVIKNDNDQLVIKNYPKEKPTNCPSCKRNNWLELDKGYSCKKCEYIINKQKHQIGKNVLRQEKDFSTGLNCANKKLREN